jgi:hypothetical protein
MLRQLGNMFIVQTDALRIFIAEQHLGRIDTQLLRPYLAERSDWGTASRNLVFPDEAAGSTGGTAMGMNTQVNRLGTLGTNIGSNIGNIGTNISGSLNSITANRRLSAMSGAAGLGYQRLRDALRDFETLTDKEKEKEKAQSGPNSRPGTGTASPARDGYGTSATTGVNKPLPPSAFGRGHMVTPGFRH